MPQPSFTKIYLKITYLKFHSKFHRGQWVIFGQKLALDSAMRVTMFNGPAYIHSKTNGNFLYELSLKRNWYSLEKIDCSVQCCGNYIIKTLELHLFWMPVVTFKQSTQNRKRHVTDCFIITVAIENEESDAIQCPLCSSSSHSFNSLIPGKFEWNFSYVIFIWILVIAGWGISCEIALILMSLDFTDDQSI